jgi:methyl-accepting chemotaxis protein
MTKAPDKMDQIESVLLTFSNEMALLAVETRDGFKEVREGFKETRESFKEVKDGLNQINATLDRTNATLDRTNATLEQLAASQTQMQVELAEIKETTKHQTENVTRLVRVVETLIQGR